MVRDGRAEGDPDQKDSSGAEEDTGLSGLDLCDGRRGRAEVGLQPSGELEDTESKE